MENSEQTPLFKEFPPVSTETWEEVIRKDLRGGDYAKKLIWDTPEGFPVRPYYRSEDLAGLEYLKTIPGEFPFLRGYRSNGQGWIVRQDIPEAQVQVANRAARHAVSMGAQAIGFDAREITAHARMKQLLEGIDLEMTRIHFFRSRSYPLTLELFLYELERRNCPTDRILGSLNFDPVSYLLEHGDFYKSRKLDLEEAGYLTETIRKRLPAFTSISVNGYRFQEAGSTLVQELAFALAIGHEYLAGLTDKGIDPDGIASRMAFTFALGPSFFMEIAKLRAARLLWSNIVNQYQPARPASCRMEIHCVTARWNKTLFDPHVNMLRTTTEGMAGVLGNADSLSILPFDIAWGETGQLGERIARNQQLIYREESYLHQIVDPGNGSYYLENLTDAMARQAWELFKQVEELGGMIECIKSGFIQDAVSRSRRKKEKDLAQRRFRLLGTNQYPDLSSQLLAKGLPETRKKEEVQAKYPRMPSFRVAEPFEELRLATERYVQAGNKRPAVFLFPMGNLAMSRTRAGFITNFLGCAGYQIMDNPCFSSIDKGVNAALSSETEMVVICSSDEEYPQIVPEIARKLKAKKPDVRVIVAGFPKETLAEPEKASVDDFIHARSNILEVLKEYQHRLGIQ